ncbi:MAG: class I SAM-dependent methyltransferase [Deltaproteobacteria bacterium]
MSGKFDPEKRFNDRAKVYDGDILKIIPGYAALHETALHLLETTLPEDAYVLVAGVGTGNEAVTLASRNPGWRITGFDIAENMIKASGEKVARLGLGDRIELIHGGLDDVLQESFDAAACLLVTHFIPYEKKLEFLRAIAFRLNPGAKLVTADFTGDRKSDEFGQFVKAWESYQLETREPEDVAEGLKHTRHDLDILSHEEAISHLEEAGFRDVRLFWKSLVFSGYIAERE